MGVVVLLAGLAVGGYKVYEQMTAGDENGETEVVESTSGQPQATVSDQLVAETASNPDILSQGEKLLLDTTPQKEAGMNAFAVKDWDTAVTEYEEAVATDRNDPEARVYYNNSKARQAGNPLTIALVLPITADVNAAKEMLRGAALYQDRFNQSPPKGRLLEMVIVDDYGTGSNGEIANDLANAPSVLGVLGHGATQDTQKALAIYDAEQVAVVSPLNTEIVVGTGGGSMLKTVSTDAKGRALFEEYLLGMNNTLLKYAQTQHGNPAVVFFYDGSKGYSANQKAAFESAIASSNAKVIQNVDIASGVDVKTALTEASQGGANTIFIALPPEGVESAIAIAKANASLPSPLTIVASDALYSPTVLVSGQDAINGLVIAVPWRHDPSQAFAQEAAQMWQGRVNWRTAAVSDAMQALVTAVSDNPQRSEVLQSLNQGVPLANTNTNFNILLEVPLVKAVPGTAGPAGAKHQFDPI